MNKLAKDLSPSTLDAEAMRMADDPAAFFGHSHTAMQSTPRETIEALQLSALRQRFDDLRDRIPMLEKLATRQGIRGLSAFEDVVPLLFEHTMYKSYPSALLDNARFADLNRWLSKLTTHDLTGIDVSGCEGIDDWMAVMDRESPLTVCHSSGTSGTMSFLPHSKAEWDRFGRVGRVLKLQPYGSDVDTTADVDLHMIYPYYRSGGSSHLRANDNNVKHLLRGREDRFVAAFPGRVSSDVLYLSGKLRAAQARGEVDRIRIPEKLMQRRAEFEAAQAGMAAKLDAFFDRALNELRGKRIFIGGTWNIIHGFAARGLERGEEAVFAPGSAVVSGGGAKGMTPPDNWQADVCRFFGVPRIDMQYGMSEVMGMHAMCEHGHYHFVPWVIPFLLDPDTSAPLARKGVATGRAAFFDLCADTRWGGFITGDELTIDWDTPCACGRTTPFIVGDIQRYSEKNGGDDKITCAATEDAHREAMDFLNNVG